MIFSETTELNEIIETTTEEGEDLPRDGKQLNEDQNETQNNPRADHPFVQYFERLKTIYELDLKILEQLADLLSAVDEEVLPALMKSLEPILPILLSQPQFKNVDLRQIIGYVTQTLQKSTFHASISTHLGHLDFLNLSKFKVFENS